MSKVIIEIEKPKRCKDCVWYQADSWFGGSCGGIKKENGWNKHIEADEEYNVQKWCPLLPKNDFIPIEWLKEWEKSYNEKLPIEFRGETIIKEILADWRKENGN